MPADAYYAGAVTWAVANGITDGMSDTEFGPDSTVTRGQAVTFLYRLAREPDVPVSDRFADVASDAWYARAVAWAVANDITDGMSDTGFEPDTPVTYAQMLTFLARASRVTVSGANWAQDAIDWARNAGATNGLSFAGEAACPRGDVVYFMYNANV